MSLGDPVAVALMTGAASALVNIAVHRTDIAWLKRQVSALWTEINIIAPRRVVPRD